MNPGSPAAATCRRDGDDILLTLRVQPRASRSEWAGMLGAAIKLRLAAPPEDGKANAELVKWLAREFGVSKSAIIIESGETGRNKRVRIQAPEKIPDFLHPA